MSTWGDVGPPYSGCECHMCNVARNTTSSMTESYINGPRWSDNTTDIDWGEPLKWNEYDYQPNIIPNEPVEEHRLITVRCYVCDVTNSYTSEKGKGISISCPSCGSSYIRVYADGNKIYDNPAMGSANGIIKGGDIVTDQTLTDENLEFLAKTYPNAEDFRLVCKYIFRLYTGPKISFTAQLVIEQHRDAILAEAKRLEEKYRLETDILEQKKLFDKLVDGPNKA